MMTKENHNRYVEKEINERMKDLFIAFGILAISIIVTIIIL